MTLVDTNIVIDVLAADADWYPWSSQKLEEIATSGPTRRWTRSTTSRRRWRIAG